MATMVTPQDYFGTQLHIPKAANNQLGFLPYSQSDQMTMLTNNIILIAVIAGIALGIGITLALARGK